MTIVRAQACQPRSVHGHLTVSLIRASCQEARPKKLAKDALAGRKIEGPEPGGFAYGHPEIRGVLELFSNPLHKFAKEKDWHIRIRDCPERGIAEGNRTGLRGMNGYESAGRYRGVNARH